MNINFKKSTSWSSHILSGSSLFNIWNLLTDNKFKVGARFWPKIFISAMISFLNTPFILAETIFYNRRIKNTPVKSPVFILGYPRSGTTFLMYLMSKDPRFAFCKMYECMGPNVMFTFAGVLRYIAGKVLPAKRPMDNLELGADVPKEEEFALGNMGVESMANALYFPNNFSIYFDRFVLFKGNTEEKNRFSQNLIRLYKKLTLKNSGKQLLLKSPFNTARIRLLLELFPDAKFIHIHRHPYSVFSSNEKLYESVLPQVSFQEISEVDMENHLFYTYSETMKRYFEDKALLNKDNLYEMSYANFIASPLEILEEVYQQLQLTDFEKVKPFFQNELKNYHNYQTNLHKEDPEKEKKVLQHWMFAYEKLGYSIK